MMSLRSVLHDIRVGLCLVALVGPSLALAQATPSAPPLTGEAAAVKKLLEQKFPGAVVSSVTKSPLAGIYEARFDDRLVYTDPKVGFVLVGSLYDANSKRNLTEERLRKLNRVAWDSLPLELAIKRVKGNGERKLTVFADADCPFCGRLERELKNVDNVTIYTFLYPIDTLHPDAARKSKAIWCAPDRLAAWDAWFDKKELPANPGECETPIDATKKLGEKLKVTATPTLIFADGTVVPGAIPSDQVETELTLAQSEVGKADAAAPAPAAKR